MTEPSQYDPQPPRGPSSQPPERPGGITNDPVIASIVGGTLLFPGICSLGFMFANPNDWIVQAFALMVLLVSLPFTLIAAALLYRAFRIRSPRGRRKDGDLR
jgi:hypothetical protein